MIGNLADFGFNSSDIERQRKAEAGLGRAYVSASHEHPDRTLILLAAGTRFRTAAANSLLLGEPEMARDLFQQSAHAYIAAGSPYGFLMQQLGTEADAEPLRHASYRPADDVFRLWARAHSQTFGMAEAPRALRHELLLYRTEPVGALGLPVGFYLNLFDAIDVVRESKSLEALKQALLPLIGIYAAGVTQGNRDRYHWTRLITRFHPAEPEVVAVLISLAPEFKARRTSVVNFIMTLPIGEPSLQLLVAVLSLYRVTAWRRRTGRRS